MANQKTIYSLQALRIAAALIVILFHIIYIFEDKLGVFDYRVLFNFGKSGVHLFFVLSGFVMYAVHKKDIGSGMAAGRSFAWKRFVRIYPTYWVLTGIVLVAMLFTSGEVKDYKYSFAYIFQSSSLLELGMMDDGLPIITPAWSLFHEVKFYLFFFLVIAIRNRTVRIFIITAILALTICNTITPGSLGTNVHSRFYFSNLNLLFVLGILSAWITDKYHAFFRSPNYIFGSVTIFVVVAIICNVQLWEDSLITDLIFGVSAFLVITSFAAYETYCASRLNNNPFRLGKRALFFADASYALYLIHIPVYIIIFMVNKRLGMPHFPFMVTMIVCAIASSLLYYKLIEYPLINLLKNGPRRRANPVSIFNKPAVEPGLLIQE